MQALLGMDCIQSGMELFPAANESQWSLIRRVIQDCDYYVLIVAGRYGSCDSNGTSYTEKEYLYAVQLNKPIVAFLRKATGHIPAQKCEPTDEGKRKLEKFKEVLEGQKLCKYWGSAMGLAAVVTTSLFQLMKSTPAPGWVRGDKLVDSEIVLRDLLKSQHRVEELETELERLRTTPPKGTEDLAWGDDIIELWYVYYVEHPGGAKANRVMSFPATWNRIFSLVAPVAIKEASEQSLKDVLDGFVKSENPGLCRQQREDEEQGAVTQIHLTWADFQRIKIQLRSLGLIMQSAKPHMAKDKETYWSLTPYGDEMMTRLWAVERTPAATQTLKP